MKRCPECRREYDNSMMFCLDDGAELLYGPASMDEPATAILQDLRTPISASPYADETTRVLEGTPTEGGTQNLARGFDRRLVFAAVGIIVLLLGGLYAYRSLFASSNQIQSIAVMPFSNDSGNADGEYLSDGITETLIKSLSQMSRTV